MRLVMPLSFETLSRIKDADLLLLRRRSPISIAGLGEYSHAMKAVWWRGDLMCCEVREWHGGRAVTLASQVRRYPGQIDVYQTNPDDLYSDFDRLGSARFSRRLCGCDYGYRSVLAASLLHLPLVRYFVHPDVEDEARDYRPPFCSQACVMADRIGGGVDPVPHLADRLVDPSRLSNTPFYKYDFTLVP